MSPSHSSGITSIAQHSSAIGLVFDRTSLDLNPLCGAFLIDRDLVVTAANVVSLFAYSPNALKVVLPKSAMEYGVQSIGFHPEFDHEAALESLERGSLANSPQSLAQPFNCCVLKLKPDVSELSESDRERLSAWMRFPLDLSKDDFRGSLEEIEMPLVLQTLNNARRNGILYLCDQLKRPIAQIFCSGGNIVSVRYYNLSDETAMYQIIQRNVASNFAFYPTEDDRGWPAKKLNRPVDMLLIEGHRRMDELNKLRSGLPPGRIYFARSHYDCDLSRISPELHPVATRVFYSLDAITPADELWMLVGADDFTIYRSLYELDTTGQISRVHDKPGQTADTHPMERVPGAQPIKIPSDVPLPTRSAAVSLSIDPNLKKTRIKSGELTQIEGPNRHYCRHDIALPPSAIGTPIFQHDAVVGMHCGMAGISDSASTDALPQQMLNLKLILDAKRAPRSVDSKAQIQVNVPAKPWQQHLHSEAALKVVSKKQAGLSWLITAIMFVVGFIVMFFAMKAMP